jgi:hypothetical protein
MSIVSQFDHNSQSHPKLRLVCLVVTFCLVSSSCSFLPNKQESAKTPVFLLTQAAPDGKTIEAVVPSSLVEKFGTLEQVVKSLPPDSKFTIMRFGKALAQFQTTKLDASDVLGAIAVFKLKSAIPANHPIWRDRNLVIIPTAQLESQVDTQTAAQAGNQPEPQREKLANQSYQLTCPPKVQPLIINKSRGLFTKLGVTEDRLDKIAIASIVCLDLDLDSQPEIVAGLRLDNPNRPAGIDPEQWQKFLALPPNARQEYSMLTILRQNAGDWQADSIITHTRALAFIGDSVSSYVLFGAQDLDGDDRAELIVQEIGLDTIDAQVIAPVVTSSVNGSNNGLNQWQWRSYYQGDRTLNIVQ